MKITRENIMDHVAEIEALGFKRWTKGDMDRLYISAEALGLDTERQTFKGERISGSLCREMANGKTYIDLRTKMIVSSNCDMAYEVAVMIGTVPITGHAKFEIAGEDEI